MTWFDRLLFWFATLGMDKCARCRRAILVDMGQKPLCTACANERLEDG